MHIHAPEPWAHSHVAVEVRLGACDQAVTALRTGRACRSGGRPLSQATSLRA